MFNPFQPQNALAVLRQPLHSHQLLLCVSIHRQSVIILYHLTEDKPWQAAEEVKYPATISKTETDYCCQNLLLKAFQIHKLA